MYTLISLAYASFFTMNVHLPTNVLTPLFTLTCGLKGKGVCKGGMWITYQQPVDNSNKLICPYLQLPITS